MAEGVRQLGLAALPWCPRSRSLQQRLALAHRWLGPPWPDRHLERLEEDPASWLGEQLALGLGDPEAPFADGIAANLRFPFPGSQLRRRTLTRERNCCMILPVI
jgi:hypothetical protein